MSDLPDFLPGMTDPRLSIPKIEDFAVWFGDDQKDLESDAEKAGISKEGMLIITAAAHLVQSGEYEDLMSTPVQMLTVLADQIELHGVKPGEDAKQCAELIRYLSQFSLMKAIPVA